MLRPTGVQSGKSRCRGKARKTQCRSSNFLVLSTINSQLSTIGAADFVPRAIMLLDVRGRLSRAKDRECRERSEALFSIRKICRRFTGARTGRASIQTLFRHGRNPPALSRQVAHESRVYEETRGALAGPKSHGSRQRLLRNGGRVRRACGEIRAPGPSRRTPDRSDRQSTARGRDRRLTPKFPPSSYRLDPAVAGDPP